MDLSQEVALAFGRNVVLPIVCVAGWIGLSAWLAKTLISGRRK